MLNQNFVRIVLICFVIASPIAWYAVKRWLEGFAYKSPVHWWIFAVALLAVGAITVLTVTLQSYRAATENPVNSIKTE
jgi:putative ABC transport system permease protein